MPVHVYDIDDVTHIYFLMALLWRGKLFRDCITAVRTKVLSLL